MKKKILLLSYFKTQKIHNYTLSYQTIHMHQPFSLNEKKIVRREK